MHFFKRFAPQMAVAAWGASVSSVAFFSAKVEREEEERRKQQYIKQGEIPPTKHIGIYYEFTPDKNPSSKPAWFNISL